MGKSLLVSQVGPVDQGLVQGCLSLPSPSAVPMMSSETSLGDGILLLISLVCTGVHPPNRNIFSILEWNGVEEGRTILDSRPFW